MYLLIDTETGGLDPKKHSLLEIYLAVMDQDLNITHDLHLQIAHDEYMVTPEAMAINMIDLRDRKGEAASDAAADINNFLSSAPARLIPVGHNVKFDIDFMNAFVERYWVPQYELSYRVLDTASIAMFLKAAGKMGAKQGISLGVLAKMYGIEHEAHTAKSDALVTKEILKKFMDLVK